MNEPPDARRLELERLQAQIATRASILHYAHGAVSTIFALMILAMAGLFEWGGNVRQTATAAFALPSAIAGAALLAYALSRFWLGRRAHLREVVLFAELQSLRRELKLEDPSALLPP